MLAGLQRSSDLLRGKHLDAVFLRKRRQRNALQPSRGWYATLESWIAGTTAPAEADGAFFGDETAEASAREAVRSVPVALAGGAAECAISGERFEEFWDAESQARARAIQLCACAHIAGARGAVELQ